MPCTGVFKYTLRFLNLHQNFKSQARNYNLYVYSLSEIKKGLVIILIYLLF